MTKTFLRFLPAFFIFTHLFYSKTVISTSAHESHYVAYNCENTNNTYALDSPFHLALNDTLFNKLPSNASQNAPFSHTNGTGIDQVNALFYCRADVGTLLCHNCAMAAANKITEHCKFKKEAIVWLQECTLRYANRDIISIVEEGPVHIYTNDTGIVNDRLLDPFKDQFDRAMIEFVKDANNSRNSNGLTTKDVNLSYSGILHCVGQCRPDIIGAPCGRCLRSALNQRDKWADTMIFTPSCFIMFDLHNSITTLYTEGPHDHRLPTIVIVVIALVSAYVIVRIIGATLCFWWYYPRIKGRKTIKQFTRTELSKAANRYIRENLLGEGAYGKVYKGTLQDERIVAIKRLKEGSHLGADQFLRELKHNICVKHQNIVEVIGFCNKSNDKLIVYEFVENNCLRIHLHGKEPEVRRLTWENRMDIAVGAAQGLTYLHDECRMIHRDIKSSNILLDSNYRPKVADFGLARDIPNDASHVSTYVKGTKSYLDPEYASTERLSKRSDVYSFGIVLLELITGKKASELENPSQIGTTLSLLEALPDFPSNRHYHDAKIDFSKEFVSAGDGHPTSNDQNQRTYDGSKNVVADDSPVNHSSGGPITTSESVGTPDSVSAYGQKASTSYGVKEIVSDDVPVNHSSGGRITTSESVGTSGSVFADGQKASTSYGKKEIVSDDVAADGPCDGASIIQNCSSQESASNSISKLEQLTNQVDPYLNANFDVDGMSRMVICAALCVYPFSDGRLGMSQAVELLTEGRLGRNEVADIIVYVRSGNQPESSNSNSYPDPLELDDLKHLATRVITKKVTPTN